MMLHGIVTAHPTYHNKQYQSYLSLQLLMHFEFAGGLKTHNISPHLPLWRV
jgi:hypothetical protein